MTFSREWNDRYKEHAQLSIWPWSDLVSYVMRYARPCSPEVTVLELGCGAGANIPFFQHLGVRYYAVEGSAVVVQRLWERFPDYRETIRADDFTQDIHFPVQFDLVVDRSSLTHNGTDDIKRCLGLVFNALKPGGKYIGIDWFSTAHSDYRKGSTDGDRYTKNAFSDGQFRGVGRVHFSDRPHLEELFGKFVIEIMEHKTIKREIPASDHVFASWNIVGRRPGS